MGWDGMGGCCVVQYGCCVSVVLYHVINTHHPSSQVVLHETRFSPKLKAHEPGFSIAQSMTTIFFRYRVFVVHLSIIHYGICIAAL